MKNYEITLEEVKMNEEEIDITWKDKAGTYFLAVCFVTGIYVVAFAIEFTLIYAAYYACTKGPKVARKIKYEAEKYATRFKYNIKNLRSHLMQ